MKNYIYRKLYHASALMESFIGIYVLFLCIVCGIGILFPIELLEPFGNTEIFLSRLSDASYLIIGVEFIKLIASHRLSTILDIMALAISREMIIHQTTPMENLLCVIAVAVIFIVLKYFLPHPATGESSQTMLDSDDYI